MVLWKKILFAVAAGSAVGLVLGISVSVIRDQNYGVYGSIVGGASVGAVAGLLIAMFRRKYVQATRSR